MANVIDFELLEKLEEKIVKKRLKRLHKLLNWFITN